MSVINKMLQELDKRHAVQNPDAPAGPVSDALTGQVRTVRARSIGSNLFWRLMAGAMVVVVAWVAWVMWQITPHSVVTDLAYQSLSKPRATPPAPAQETAMAPASTPAAPASVGTAPAATATAPSAAPPVIAPATPKIDMLRLATEIATPINSTRAKSAPAPRMPDRETIAALERDTRAAPTRDARATAPTPDTRTAKLAGQQAEPPAPKARAAAASSEAARIEKRVDGTPRERAEAEFRRAMSQVNQGRMAEGMDGLRAALAADPSYETARQTLVALLLEARRTEEAAGLLQEGLAITPANVGYAMLLARIQVERGDVAGALALLQKVEPAARTNAEYHAFVAALYQRMGRHAEAVEQYQGALRLAGGTGAWWAGLGISQEALSRQQDATESFQRAKGTGNLNAELLAYVDRRLKQLR